MKLGETKLIRKTVIRKTCYQCGEIATRQVWFTYINGRNNPKSSMYGKDDCTYCSDEIWNVCEAHYYDLGTLSPHGMEESNVIKYSENNPHYFLEWKEEEVKEQLASEFLRQFQQEVDNKKPAQNAHRD